MSYPALLEYLQSLSIIYFKSTREKKTQLLDDAEKIAGKHRKHLIRIINRKQIKNNKKSNCGAKKKYPEELLMPHIRYLWIEMDRISAKLMKAAFDDWLPKYHDNNVTPQVKILLCEMSCCIRNIINQS